MTAPFALRSVVPVLLLVLLVSASRKPQSLPIVEANDNRTPAGTLQNGVLTVSLVVGMARWYPEAADGPFAEVEAFGEEGKAPQIPGPLIRVPQGTMVSATIRNALVDSTVWIRGLVTRPASRPDSIPIKPGEKIELRFLAGAPGTYLYYATPGIVDYDKREREQLMGALVVDSAGARTDDRILMINIWGEPVDSTRSRNAYAINGKSWPHTERFHANVGDSLRWRVINGSMRGHPMHLHGFYFRVDSRGTYLADTVLGERRREAVTENMPAFATMSMVWSPDRPGNWLFHCHLTFHVVAGARLDGHEDQHDHVADPMRHMAGLVTGITVRDPYGLEVKASGPVRKLRLFANEHADKGRTGFRMTYVLQRDELEPARDSVEYTGGLLLFERGERAEVTVINRTHSATSVHWHGLELESYSDGVAGWSGLDMNVAPTVAPNDSFIARLSVPRAGTFIYHTHLNDLEQLRSGAWGPLIVLEKGEKFDPETDHVFTIGLDVARRSSGPVVNGDSIGAPMFIEAGTRHRFRFVNITAAGSPLFTILKDTVPVTWIPRAKDGADYNANLRAPRRAIRGLGPGETYDAEWAPTERGEYMLRIGNRTRAYYTRKIIVR
jgi:FtsP/CotA-like multicopper oxidase with cupredoxin domain